MPNINNQTLHQLDALNNWLDDVYGEETNLTSLLIDADFSEAEIARIQHNYLAEFLQAVMDLLASYVDLPSEGRNNLMIQHYGLNDGEPQGFYKMGAAIGLCGERMRQLVNQRLNLYHDPNRQEALHSDLAAIGRQLLDNE